MTDSAAFAEFSAALDAAVARARRVTAAARETSAKFRRETRQLAAGLRAGTATARPDEVTDDRLRRTAAGFRTDHGLPVHDVPAPAAPTPDAPPEPMRTHTFGPLRTTPPGRRFPPPSDDDEDFSQERIMR